MIEGRQARGRASEQRGRRGEVWAALLLTLKGYRILGKRVRTQLGEINLIARAAALYLATRPGLAKKGVRFDVVAGRAAGAPAATLPQCLAAR